MSQLFFMFILFTLVLVRALYLRRQSFVMTPNDASASIGGWMLIVSMLLYPVFEAEASWAFSVIIASPFLLFIGLLKGAGFWVMSYAGQTLRKTSNSSASFFGFICIGLIALGNAVFGENLSVMQWVSVAILTLTGLLFTIKGHLNTQSRRVQSMFLLMVFMGCMFGMIDHYFISHVNWYGLLFLTGAGMTTVSLLSRGVGFKHVKSCVFNRRTMKIGMMMAVSEVMILSIMVTHLPVTLAWVAMTLTGPVIMVISSLLWGEGRWQDQLLIGGVSYAAAIPIALSM
ncbi:MAG: hypothetical protein ACI9TY_001119 [Alphaproteobacteria bacterium]|jgi:hypothetical protein